MINEQIRPYEFDDFRLDAVKRLLTKGEGELVPLTPKVFDTLLYLVERAGKIVEKDELMAAIWSDTVVEENNLSQNISILRRVLGEKKNAHRFIVTVPGKGFKFVAEVSEKELTEEIPIETQSAKSKISVQPRFNVERKGNILTLADWQPEREDKLSAATADARHPTSSAEYLIGEIKSRKRAFAVGLTVLLFAAIGSGYWFFANPSSNAAIESIAVLPFENGSGDANLDYLSDGLSESVIDRLSQLPQLKIIARSSSFKYRGENIDVQNVASKLGVQAIVMGKVVQRGDNLSIRVEMVDASDNKQLWGEQYNRKVTDALTIQQEIAQMVSEKLRLKLSGAQEQQLANQGTTNPQAYELLLRGQFYASYASKGGMEYQKKAADYFEQAIAVDPNYALAYARLSRTYIILASASIVDPKEFIPKAQAAARKALELDENLADAHLAMAYIYQNAWDWAAAEAEYKRAIELNPNLTIARLGFSVYLSCIGRHEQALAEVKRAKELDPLSLYANLNVGKTLLLARRYDEAIVETKKILELDNGYVFAYDQLGFIYAAKGMYREAVAAYEESNRLGGTNISMQIYLGAAYARAGEREKAQAILKQLETSKEYVSPGELTVLYVALDEREKAFASLEKAYAAHDLQLQFIKVDPAFDPLRSDQRFQDLLRRVGLPQ